MAASDPLVAIAVLAGHQPAQAAAQYEALIMTAETSEEAIKVKEQAIYKLSDLYTKHGEAQKIGALLRNLRPFFVNIPKAKTAKIVRMLIDQVAKISDSKMLQMSLCRESIEWCHAEKRSFLRQRMQSRLAALLLESKQYTDALALLSELLSEVKRLDDKPLLVEISLVESETHHALRNLPRAKAALTAARTAANAIYCPPLLQAQIDLMSGTLHAEERDFKTAFSYFYEAFENFDTAGAPKAVDCLKYMLLSKIMMNAPDEVSAIINAKPGLRHQGPGLRAMRAVANAHQQRSLEDFEASMAQHSAQLNEDPIISHHLNSLYDMLLQENIIRLIEPYSNVETSHLAQLMDLPLAKIEHKLSQMILDKRFNGILDAGAGCLIVYPGQSTDVAYEESLVTLDNMGRVVDALSSRASGLAPNEA